MNEYIKWRAKQIETALYSMMGKEKDLKLKNELRYWKREFEKGAKGNPYYLRQYQEHLKLYGAWWYDKKLLDIGSGPFDTFINFQSAKDRHLLDPLLREFVKLHGYWNFESMLHTESVENMDCFSSNYFDYIFSFNSLDHCDDIVKAIDEIHRVLNENGKFYCIVEIGHEKLPCEPISIPVKTWYKLFKKFEILDSILYQKIGRMDLSLKEKIPYNGIGTAILITHMRKQEVYL